MAAAVLTQMHRNSDVRTGQGLLLPVVRFLQTKFLDRPTFDDGLGVVKSAAWCRCVAIYISEGADTDTSSKSAMTWLEQVYILASDTLECQRLSGTESVTCNPSRHTARERWSCDCDKGRKSLLRWVTKRFACYVYHRSSILQSCIFHFLHGTEWLIMCWCAVKKLLTHFHFLIFWSRIFGSCTLIIKFRSCIFSHAFSGTQIWSIFRHHWSCILPS